MRFTLALLSAAVLLSGCQPFRGGGQSQAAADVAECEQYTRSAGSGAVADCLREKAQRKSASAPAASTTR